MSLKMTLNIAVTAAILLTNACRSTGLEAMTPEETTVKREIESWPEMWKTGSDDPYRLAKSTLADIRTIPQYSRRKLWFKELVNRVLASSFSVCPPFPVEDWETRPIYFDENDPRRTLARLHRTIVDIGEMLYYEERSFYAPLTERLDLVLRFTKKMDGEKLRLNTMEVGDAGKLVDMFERDFWYSLQRDKTGDLQPVKTRFEHAVGHQVRDPSQIRQARREFNRKHDEVVGRNMEAYRKKLYEELKKQNCDGNQKKQSAEH